MSQAISLSPKFMLSNYDKQSPSREPTARQMRRVRKKINREKGHR